MHKLPAKLPATYNFKRIGRRFYLLLLSLLVLNAASLAEKSEKKPEAENLKTSSIPNFIKVNDFLYRGGQPDSDGFNHLKTLGVKTIINLRRGDTDKTLIKEPVFRQIWKPTSPRHVSDDEILWFLRQTNKNKSTPLFIHCRHGKDRTGVFIAMYRMVIDGWTKERALSEMHESGFDPYWKELLEYVNHADINKIKKQLTKENYRISITNFNVENLFDTFDNPYTDDQEFLPLETKSSREIQDYCLKFTDLSFRNRCLFTDWSNKTYNTKIQKVSSHLKSLSEGQGSDILVLQEIENRQVLEDLLTFGIKDPSYTTLAHKDFSNSRGVDVAVISRLPMALEPEIIKIIPDNTPGISPYTFKEALKVVLKLPDGEKLSIYVTHLPSDSKLYEARREALKLLSEYAQKDGAVYKIIAGDFNIYWYEEEKRQTISKYIEPEWIVSHKAGKNLPSGTCISAGKHPLSFCDMILFSKSFERSSNHTWALDFDSIKVNLADDSKKSPQSFDPVSLTGLSDHWSVSADIYTGSTDQN